MEALRLLELEQYGEALLEQNDLYFGESAQPAYSTFYTPDVYVDEFPPSMVASEPFEETFPLQFGGQASEGSAEAEMSAVTYEEENPIVDTPSVEGAPCDDPSEVCHEKISSGLYLESYELVDTAASAPNRVLATLTAGSLYEEWRLGPVVYSLWKEGVVVEATDVYVCDITMSVG